MKKILLTWAKGMLGTDFIKHFGDKFEIFPLDRNNGDITNMESMDILVQNNRPDLIVNFAAYTNVEDAEDPGMKTNFDVNALWAYNLAKISAKYSIDLITISTDYVFDGTKKEWYTEEDAPNPINSYGMAKYLWEKLVKQENPDSIIIRTSWLYWWGKEFKNFVNTMLRLSETKKELKVVNDQFGSPTYTVDLSGAIVKVIDEIENYRWKILHFCDQTEENWITWFEFAQEIFKQIPPTPLSPAKLDWSQGGNKGISLVPCSSEEFPTKAKRPKWSKLVNPEVSRAGRSEVRLRDWKEGVKEYFKDINSTWNRYTDI